MKKSISILLAILFVTCMFTGCKKVPDLKETNISKINISHLSEFALDLSNAKGLGIQKGSVQVQTPTAVKTSVTKLSDGTDLEDKNYIYVETEDNDIEVATLTNIDEDEEDITQDDIPAQINKLRVCRGFTFMQFVPIVDETGEYYYEDENGDVEPVNIDIRPLDIDLIFNEDGTTSYDNGPYYTDDFSQSFIMDNATGKLYLLEGFVVEKIINDVIVGEDGLLYGMIVNTDGSLQFYTLYQNETIVIIDYFRDTYGTTYIKNDAIDEISVTKNVIFYKTGKYILSNEGVAIYIKSTSTHYLSDITEIKKVINCQLVPIATQDHFTFGRSLTDKYIGDTGYNAVFHEIIDGYLYVTYDFDPSTAGGIQAQYILSCSTLEINRHYTSSSYSELNYDDYDYYDRSTVLAFHAETKELVYFSISDTNLIMGLGMWIDGFYYSHIFMLKEPESILTNCQPSADWYPGIREFRQIDSSGTISYIVTKTENGYEAILESIYIADGTKNIVLQPIV